MAYPSQQPGFDPSRQPPQWPQGQPGGHPVPQPGYGQPPPWYGYPPPRRKPGPGVVFGLLIGAMVLIIVVGLLIGNGTGDDGGEPSASDSPEDVVERYLDAQIAVLESDGYVDFEDLSDAIAPYLCSEVRAEMSEALEDLDAEVTPMPYSDVDVDYEITGSLVEDDVAVVYVEFRGEMTLDGYEESLDSSDSVDLVREDGTWLVCDGSAGTYV